MQYTRLGRSGLTVSRIALGCMSFGVPATDRGWISPPVVGGGAPSWTLTADDAMPVFRQALDLGITFWDTANVYNGRSTSTCSSRDEPRTST
jgi:1-deoxyxylulose-5-phosphate synthase